MKRILFILLAFVFSVPAAAAKYATVGAKYANVRTCGGDKCAVKWKAWRFTPLYMMGVSEDKKWVQVRNFNGNTGWIHHTMLSEQKGVSAIDDVNVRTGPGSSNDIACTVSKGYPLKFISIKGGWIQVQDEPETAGDPVCKGWISAAFVWGPRAKGESPN